MFIYKTNGGFPEFLCPIKQFLSSLILSLTLTLEDIIINVRDLPGGNRTLKMKINAQSLIYWALGKAI